MLDPFFVALSVVGSFGAIWIAFALVLAVVRRRPAVFMLVTAGVLTADMLALLLKLAGGRERPFIVHPEPEPLVGTPVDLSFPSGHASTAFAGATLVTAFVPRFAVPLYALAVLIAWSRVYVGVHYPLDILAGAVLGTAVGLLFTYLERHRPMAGRSRRAPAP